MKIATVLAAASFVALAFGFGVTVPLSGAAQQRGGGAPAATTPAGDRQAEFGRFPGRPFLRQNLDKLTWTATEGNKLGVQTAVLEGDPSKPGFYLIINRFPPGVMSRPHFHNQDRLVTVIKGTWWTATGPDGDVYNPEKTKPNPVGSFMKQAKVRSAFGVELELEPVRWG